ncbi:endolytic transglycosylase MltG, partial [Patescibacteria group bacterium]|nr:endolytic transglycosylase MltG [Patescibacteria group bacterium]
VAVFTLWVVLTIVGSGRPVGPVQRVVVASSTAADVAAALKSSGALSPSAQMLFPFFVRFHGMEAGLHPGTFLIPAHAPLRQVVRILLQHGRTETRVTIPEGSSLRDLADILQKAGLAASADDVFAVTGTPASEKTETVFSEQDFSFFAGKPQGISLEGYLFPDTYRFFADASVRDVAQKMLETFDGKTKDLRTEPLPYPLLSFYDVLTLASVLEAEVQGPEDQRRVADLFLRRIAAGMPLQADSTVHYASGASGRFTTAADRESESLWNTYQHPGLPRGPIANPGLEAIRAVLDPAPNDAVYFLTGPDGTVYYAKTLEEHVANKRHL